jgi:hypothetical protein
MIQELSKYSRFVREGPSTSIFADKKTVRVRHNADALDKARIRFLGGINGVREMPHSLLVDLKTRIEELENEFIQFKFTTMEVEEVSESRAGDMRPAKPTMALATNLIA